MTEQEILKAINMDLVTEAVNIVTVDVDSITLDTSDAEMNIIVGKHLNILRRAHGMSMRELGSALEVALPYQQIQKYEKGTNRIRATTLYSIARFFDVPITYFFGDGL